MIEQLLKRVRRRRFYYVGLGLTVVLLAAGLVGYLRLEQIWHARASAAAPSTAPTSLQVAKGLLLVGMFGSVIVALGLSWIVGQTAKESLKHLAEASHTLEMDCDALSTALAELARGNLTPRLTIQSQPVDLAASEVSQLADLFNAIVASVQESAEEFNAVTDEPCRRLCYVGADSYLEGRTCGEVMGQAIGSEGQVAIITGSFTQGSLESRRKGFESLLREKYPEIQVVDVAESHDRPEESYLCTQTFLKRYPALTGIYVTEGGSPSGAARAVVEAGAVERVKIVSHDLVDETMQYVQQGVIAATLGQDPFAQGHDSVIHLFNYLVTGRRPVQPRLLTNMDVVTRDNYEQFWQPGRGVIESKGAADRLAKPVRQSSRPLRIAVLGREDSAFWDPVREGVLAAAAKLRPYNATVEWIVPERHRSAGDISAAAYGPAIESLVTQGYNALATAIFDKNLVPYINRAVAAGVPVATYNSEPSSLRGLFTSLSERAQELKSLSQNFAGAAQNSEAATEQMASTIQQMAISLADEAASVGRTTENVQQIARAAEDIAQGAREQGRAAESVSVAVSQISQAIETAVWDAQTVAETASQAVDTVTSATAKMQEMATHSEQIGNIVNIIDDIAHQTNLLSLNARIEAAQAGEHGRGFAIVANEVRNLAKRSTEATHEIAALIHTVVRSITEVSAFMEVAMGKVQEGSILATRSGKTLDQLLASATPRNQQTEAAAESDTEMSGAVNNLSEAVDQVSAVIERHIVATEELRTNIKEMLDAVENVAAISEENAASTEDVSATTEEVTGQTQEVSQSARALAAMAEELQSAIAQFEIENHRGAPA